MKKNGSSKKEAFKSFFLPLIVLVAICAVIGSAMAAINLITAPKIEEAQAQKKQEALSAVVPDNKGFEKLSLSELPESVTEVYADKGSASLALMLSVKGYDSSKPMSIAVGFDENGEIIAERIRPLTMRQTYRQEMKWLVELCGFEVVDIYKDYVWNKADEKAGNCIWVLKKK